LKTIDSLDELRALYDDTVPGALAKVVSALTPLYQQWIEASRFTIVSTVGEQGTDASPRGDRGPVVKIVDPKTLWMPDWRGNNRLDTLQNIVTDGRISLMFMVPGCNNVVRINGRAVLTADEEVRGVFKETVAPRTVIVVTIQEAYFQCAKALMRSKLWSQEDQKHKVPTAGQFVGEVQDGFDVKAYDDGYAEYAKDKMW